MTTQRTTNILLFFIVVLLLAVIEKLYGGLVPTANAQATPNPVEIVGCYQPIGATGCRPVVVAVDEHGYLFAHTGR